MIYLLLSLVVLVVQGILGMADWWVLGSNFVFAGLLVSTIAWLLTNQGLFNFNHPPVIIKGVAILGSVMNLSAICLDKVMPWWQLDLLITGFTAILLLGMTCWQSKSLPMPTLLLGVMVGLLTAIYLPSLFALAIVLAILLHCACFSSHNLACMVTGMVTGVWTVYCLSYWWVDGDWADDYLLSFAFDWDEVEYDLVPTVVANGFTGAIFLVSTLLVLVAFMIRGLFMGNYNSLRMRSNVSLHSTLGLIYLALMPTCWPLYLTLATLSMIFHLFLSMTDEFSRKTKMFSSLLTAFYLVLGVGEPLLLMTIDFFRTVTWPWETWSWPW